MTVAIESANEWVQPPFPLNVDNVFKDPIYRGKSKTKTIGGEKITIPDRHSIDAAEVNTVLITVFW